MMKEKHTVQKHKAYKRIIAMILVIAMVASFMRIPMYAEAASGTPQVMVSLGDSYSSGEGIDDFYGTSSDVSAEVQSEDWLAHRSQRCWPGQLKLSDTPGKMGDAANKDEIWYFKASSGAVSADIVGKKRNEVDEGDGIKHTGQVKKYNKKMPDGSYLTNYKELDPQIKIFEELRKNNITVSYVTLTLGGNDIGFSDIVSRCVKNITYLNNGEIADTFELTWYSFTKPDGIRNDIKNVYKKIQEEAGSQAHIIVAGYPKLFSSYSDITSLCISEYEVNIVNYNAGLFNDAIENIVAECQTDGNMNISYVSVQEVFEGHEAYSISPYINRIYPFAQKDELNDRTIGSAYSIHPNAKGAVAYATCVQDMINRIEAGEDTSVNARKNPGLSSEDLKKKVEDEIERRKEELKDKQRELIHAIIEEMIKLLISYLKNRFFNWCKSFIPY